MPRQSGGCADAPKICLSLLRSVRIEWERMFDVGSYRASCVACPSHQLDLFTAVAGGGGVGGITGGGVAWLVDEDMTQGGVLGGVLGMTFGALLAILQAAGLYS